MKRRYPDKQFTELAEAVETLARIERLDDSEMASVLNSDSGYRRWAPDTRWSGQDVRHLRRYIRVARRAGRKPSASRRAALADLRGLPADTNQRRRALRKAVMLWREHQKG